MADGDPRLPYYAGYPGLNYPANFAPQTEDGTPIQIIPATASVPETKKRTSPNTRRRSQQMIGLAISALVIFFPLGIPALVIALQVDQTTYDADAQKKLKTSMILSITAIVLGVLFSLLCVSGLCEVISGQLA